jgi:ATP-binding cassette, subfamily B, bacterial
MIDRHIPFADLPPSNYRNLRQAELPHTPLGFLTRFLWARFRWRVVAAVLCTLGGIGLMSLEPIFLGRLVEGLRLGGSQGRWPSAVWVPFALVAGAWIVSAMFNRLGEIVDLETSPHVREEIQVYLFSWLIDHSPEYFHRNFAGQLAAKIKQAGNSAISILSLATNDVVRVIASVVISVLIIGLDHPGLALMVVVWTPVYVGISLLLASRRKTLSKAFQDQVSASTGVVVDLVKNADLVRSFAKSDEESRHVGRAVEKERAASKRLRWYATGMNLALYTGMQIFQIALIGVTLYLTVRGQLVIGDTVKMLSLSTLLMNNIWGAASRMLELLEHSGQFASALELILVPHAIADAEGARPLLAHRGEIRIEGLRFGYADDKPVFDGLSLSIPAAQKVAVVGPSGSGKSTLVKMLRRDYQPQAGRVLIDGQDIALASQASVNEAIAEIPQQPGLFHRSIRDNISYARDDASDAEIAQCARYAHAEGFIAERAMGFDAIVGEQGIQLSGGERQRVAIARALLKDAPIIILDEATASLDSETEHVIHDALWRLFRGRTVIAIAHRLSTITRMDRILFVQDGRILEDGTHRELLQRNGRYAESWRRQVGGFLGQ